MLNRKPTMRSKIDGKDVKVYEYKSANRTFVIVLVDAPNLTNTEVFHLAKRAYVGYYPRRLDPRYDIPLVIAKSNDGSYRRVVNQIESVSISNTGNDISHIISKLMFERCQKIPATVKDQIGNVYSMR